MSSSTALQQAIACYVDEKKAAGAVVDVNRAAISLASEYPQTGLSIDEIADTIARTAVRRGTPLLIEQVGAGAVETE